MPANFSTSNRMYFLTLEEYGEDDLLIQEMSGTEGISQLFEFRLRLISSRDDIDVTRIIGKTAILRIETPDPEIMGGERHWNGYVSRFARSGRARSADGEDMYTYECDIVPWFWFMTQHEDCRIFQNKTVRDIIETIFGEFNYSDFKMELNEQHPTLEYCTQYQETTFDFISRLIEREGIHYYFRHNEDEDSKHILVFTDNNDSNPKLDPDEFPFHHEGQSGGLDAVRKLTLEQQMRTRKVTLGDWDFEKKRPVRENTPTVLTIGEDRDLERYRYPGGFVESQEGQHLSRMIMEAEEASHLRLRGESQIRAMAPGHRFTLYDHTFEAFNIEYLVLSVWHHGRNNLTGDGPSDYGNGFHVHPHTVTYRAPLVTPKGLVRGPQTALVTGPRGEEIYTDEHGRIKVQFHWDRQGQYDDKTTCWIRVAQVWAGNGYGTMFIPRVGMEVVVDFLEGDPDRPLVTGCVYNGINKPPYDLPANATRSTIKTLSSKGGGGFNELRFEDKKGSEEIFMHAQKDLQSRVLEKAQYFVGKDMHAIVKENRYEQTVLDAHQTTEGKRVAFVKGDEHLKVTGDLKFKSDAGSMNVEAATDVLVKGGVGVHLKGGTNVVVEAGTTISLKVGSNFISISSAGVSIVGSMVMINSGGASMPATAPAAPDEAEAPEEAVNEVAGTVTDPIQQMQAQALVNAAEQGQPFCAECAAARAAYQALSGHSSSGASGGAAGGGGQGGAGSSGGAAGGGGQGGAGSSGGAAGGGGQGGAGSSGGAAGGGGQGGAGSSGGAAGGGGQGGAGSSGGAAGAGGQGGAGSSGGAAGGGGQGGAGSSGGAAGGGGQGGAGSSGGAAGGGGQGGAGSSGGAAGGGGQGGAGSSGGAAGGGGQGGAGSSGGAAGGGGQGGAGSSGGAAGGGGQGGAGSAGGAAGGGGQGAAGSSGGAAGAGGDAGSGDQDGGGDPYSGGGGSSGGGGASGSW